MREADTLPLTVFLMVLLTAHLSPVGLCPGDGKGALPGPDWDLAVGEVVKDVDVALGLRVLGKGVELCAVLQFTVPEWNSLRSLETEVSMTKEGYGALLMQIRGSRMVK